MMKIKMELSIVMILVSILICACIGAWTNGLTGSMPLPQSLRRLGSAKPLRVSLPAKPLRVSALYLL